MRKKECVSITHKQVLHKKRDFYLSAATHNVCPLKNKNQTKEQYEDESRSVSQRPHAGRAHLLKKLLFKRQRKSQAFSWAPCQHPIKSFSTAQVLRCPPTDFIKFFHKK